MNKKAVLIVSYGTSYKEEYEDVILKILHKAKNEFSSHDVMISFTSKIVIGRLYKKYGIEVDSFTKKMIEIKESGYTDVIIQPLHLIKGVEYNKITEVSDIYKDYFNSIKIGTPLLDNDNSYDYLINSIKSQFDYDDNKAYVLMGHGSEKTSNISYEKLQEASFRNNINFYIGLIKGSKDINTIIEELKSNNEKDIVLAPLTLVFGFHASNDMTGDDNSWKSILKRNGFNVELYKYGLGRNEKIQDIYIDNLKEMINNSQ